MKRLLAVLAVSVPLLAPTQAAAATPDCGWQMWIIYPFYCATGLDPLGIVIEGQTF